MKQRALLLLLLLLAACKTPGAPPPARDRGLPEQLRLHLIDVGQGSALLVETPCAAALIDTGGEKNDGFQSTEVLLDYLETFFSRRDDLSRELALLVITHPHIDHTRAVSKLVEETTVKNVLTNGLENSSGGAQQKKLHNLGVPVHRATVAELGPQGLTNVIIDPIACEGADPKITVLWGRLDNNPGWPKDQYENANNHSVVLRIDAAGSSLLITGDLEDAAIPMLVEKYRGTNMLDADIYLAGHHGSHNGTTAELLQAVTPELALISMGTPDREYLWTAWKFGHPRRETVELLAAAVTRLRPQREVLVGTKAETFESYLLEKAIYATGWDGTLLVELEPGKISLRRGADNQLLP